MDRGICVANTAMYIISSIKLCLLFSLHISNILPWFAVSDTLPSNYVDKK
jgi:hypothetical protein